MCLDTSHFVRASFLLIDIVIGVQYFMPLTMKQTKCVTVHEFAICFEVDDAIWFEDFFVAIQKLRIGHTVFGTLVLDLWIRKGNPDFIDFVLSEGILNEFNLCSKENNISNAFFNSSLCASPKTRAFNVNTDKVFFGITLRQGNTILSFATAKFQNYWIVIFENTLVPMAFGAERFGYQFIARWLYDIAKGFVFPEPLEFVLASHYC